MKINGQYVKTLGGKLLADGFFKYGRKINYLGDFLWFLGLALVCNSYFLMIFVLILLLFRSK